MTEKQELTLQLKRIVEYVKKYKWIMILWTILIGIVGGMVAEYFTPKVYYSSAYIYVRPHNLDGEIYAEDLNVSKELVRDYIEIIQSRPVLENAIANLELQEIMNYESLQSQMYVSAEYQSKMIEVLVADSLPARAQKLTEEICRLAEDKTTEMAGVSWTVISDPANLPSEPSFPVRSKVIFQSCVLAIAAIFLWLVIITSGEYKFRCRKDVEEYLQLPLLGEMPKTATKKKLKR